MAVHWWNSVTGMHLPAPQSEHVFPPRNPDRQPQRSGVIGSAADHPTAQAPPPFSSLLVPDFVPPEQSTPGWILTFKLLERLVKGYTWVGGFLLLVGLVSAWRIFLRPEHLTLFCMNVLLLLIARVRYWTSGLDLRYFMPMVIVAVPWMALGLEYTIAFARRLVAAARSTLAARLAHSGRRTDRGCRGRQLARCKDAGSRLYAEACRLGSLDLRSRRPRISFGRQSRPSLDRDVFSPRATSSTSSGRGTAS